MDKLKGISRMLFDIYDEDLVSLPILGNIYHELNNIKEKKIDLGIYPIENKDRKMLIYVALMYDKYSPIRKETLVNRKAIAIEQAGIRVQAQAEQFANLELPRMIVLIHYYLKYQNDKAWATLCTMNDFFWELQLNMSNTNVSQSDDPIRQLTLKAKLREEFEKTMESIQRQEDIIFGDNKEKREVIINFYPEDYATLLAQMSKDYV